MQIVKIKNLGKVLTGKTPSTKKPELFGDNYPFITPSDISSYDVYHIQNTERGLSEEGYTSQKSKLLPQKTICYVCIGSTIGKICLTKIPSFTNQQLNNIIVDQSKYVPEYIYYRLRYETPKIQSIAGGTGSGKAIYNKTAFEDHRLEIHDYPLQQKIASILSTYDDLIENNTRRIQIFEEMAHFVYQEWFINFRFPGHEKVKFVNSELGKIPEGWEVKRLSKVVEIQYGYTESASEEIIGPKFLRGKDINKNSYIIWDEVPYCKIEPDDYEKYKLNRDDIVIIRMADPGKVGIVEKDIDAIFASYLIRLKIKNGMEPYYLFYFLLSDRYQSYISGASTGTTRKSASAGVITDIDILLPDEPVSDQFVDVIKPLRQLLNTLLEKNENLRKSRDLLLPKLISGELDVSDLEIATQEQEA